MYSTAWNPDDPCFDGKRPCLGGSTFKNGGHLGSRWIVLQQKNMESHESRLSPLPTSTTWILTVGVYDFKSKKNTPTTSRALRGSCHFFVG